MWNIITRLFLKKDKYSWARPSPMEKALIDLYKKYPVSIFKDQEEIKNVSKLHKDSEFYKKHGVNLTRS